MGCSGFKLTDEEFVVERLIVEKYEPCRRCSTGRMDLVELSKKISLFEIPIWDAEDGKLQALRCSRCYFAIPYIEIKQCTAVQEDDEEDNDIIFNRSWNNNESSIKPSCLKNSSETKQSTKQQYINILLHDKEFVEVITTTVEEVCDKALLPEIPVTFVSEEKYEDGSITTGQTCENQPIPTNPIIVVPETEGNSTSADSSTDSNDSEISYHSDTSASNPEENGVLRHSRNFAIDTISSLAKNSGSVYDAEHDVKEIIVITDEDEKKYDSTQLENVHQSLDPIIVIDDHADSQEREIYCNNKKIKPIIVVEEKLVYDPVLVPSSNDNKTKRRASSRRHRSRHKIDLTEYGLTSLKMLSI